MAYQRQGFYEGMTLEHTHLEKIEDGILEGASLEIENQEETVLKAGNSIETLTGYVNPSQKIGSAVTFGGHSTSYKFVIPANAVVWMEPVTGGSYGFALCDEN